jgi:hypothetical protein
MLFFRNVRIRVQDRLLHASIQELVHDQFVLGAAIDSLNPSELLHLPAGRVRVLAAGYERFLSAGRIPMVKPLPCGFENHSSGGMFFDRSAGI